MTLNDIPNSYNQALRMFGTRKAGKDRKPVCNNTYLYEKDVNTPLNRDRHAICLHYHATTIITWADDGCVLLDAYNSVSTNDRFRQAGMPSLGYCRNPYIKDNTRWWAPFLPGSQGVPGTDIWIQQDVENGVRKRFLGLAAGPRVEQPRDIIVRINRSEANRLTSAKRRILKYLRSLDAALSVAGTGHHIVPTPEFFNPDVLVDFGERLRQDPDFNMLAYFERLSSAPVERQLGIIKAMIGAVEGTTPSNMLGSRFMGADEIAGVDLSEIRPAKGTEPKALDLYEHAEVWTERLPAHNGSLTEEEVEYARVK